jgi:FKBP-type peptidyl-prolyl cis-trans isomerase 2
MSPKFEKKPPKNWTKIGAVVLGVLFAVAMVVSTFGTGWITTMFTSAAPGDSVTIDFTIRDAAGRPVLTSSQQVFKNALQNQMTTYYSKQLAFLVNSTVENPVTSVPVYVPGSGWTGQFAIFVPEYNAITSALVGMKSGETKAVKLPEIPALVRNEPNDNFAKMGISVSSLRVGDQIQMGVTTLPEGASTTNVTAGQIAFRIASVTDIRNDSVQLDSSYSTVDLTVVTIEKAS